MNSLKKKGQIEQVLCYAILILLAMVVMVPVMWMVSTAFKTEARPILQNLSGFLILLAWDPLKNFSPLTILEE